MIDLRKQKLLAATAGALLLLSQHAVAGPPGELPFGVYDPDGAFTDDADVSIEHLFLPWEDVFLPSLYEADDYALERGRSILVTIEPWTWTRSERNTPEVLRTGIESGEYDGNMAAICTILSEFESPVTVRWGHEMEDESGQFIWANWKPETYIKAYRRMTDVCRAAAPEVDFMWSPLGDEGLEDYFPGEDYVDVIGISVFGLQPWENDILGQELSFREILIPRYERVLPFNLPIVVAEIGYSGNLAYVEKWRNDIRQDIEGLTELQAVIYFNQTEVYPWPNGYGLPDWKVSKNVIEDGSYGQ